MSKLCYLMGQKEVEMKTEKSRLAIFDTFKTKTEQITGEASRQRAIIHHLSNSTNSHQRRELRYLKALQRKIRFCGRISIQEYSEIWMKF